MASALSPAEQAEKYNVSVGQLVGNYRIERLIDEGGMGAVFAAVHKDIGRRAAVKVLMRSYARDPEFAARFLNEARAVNLINHPGVVEIFEFGRLDEETPYIIMEFLQGESIQARLTGDKKREIRQSLEWCRQIALALAAAHKNGVIHRDLKPQNVFLIPDPLTPGRERVKILDFGIAKVRPDGQNAGLTRTGATMGSPLYMAPEQCYEMGTVTDRADVYGLGIIAYELLAGRLPFMSDLPAEVMVMQVKNTPPPLRELNPTIPQSAVSIVDSLLRKAPTERPSMEEVAQRLEKLLTSGALKPSSGLGAKLPLIIGGGLAALGIAALAFVMLRGTPPPQGNPKQPPKPALAVTEKPTQSAVTGDPKPAPPPTPLTVPSKMIHYVLTSDPPGARVVDADDGEDLGTTPVTLDLPRSDEPLKVILRRAGFQDRALNIDCAADGESSQKLSPTKRARPVQKHQELMAPKL